MTEEETKKCNALIKAAGDVKVRKDLKQALNNAAASDLYAGVFLVDGRVLVPPNVGDANTPPYRRRLTHIGALVRPAMQAMREQNVGAQNRGRGLEARALGNPTGYEFRIDLDGKVLKCLRVRTLGKDALAFGVIGTHLDITDSDNYELEQAIPLYLDEIASGFLSFEKEAHAYAR